MTEKISQILEHLFISPVLNYSDVPEIKEKEIRAIVDLMERWETPPVPLVDHLKVPLKDGKRISEENLDKIYTFIYERIEYKKVLVICAAGKSRSSGIVTGYILKEHPQWSWEKAEDFVSQFHKINPHPQIRESILEYIKK